MPRRGHVPQPPRRGPIVRSPPRLGRDPIVRSARFGTRNREARRTRGAGCPPAPNPRPTCPVLTRSCQHGPSRIHNSFTHPSLRPRWDCTYCSARTGCLANPRAPPDRALARLAYDKLPHLFSDLPLVTSRAAGRKEGQGGRHARRQTVWRVAIPNSTAEIHCVLFGRCNSSLVPSCHLASCAAQ